MKDRTSHLRSILALLLTLALLLGMAPAVLATEPASGSAAAATAANAGAFTDVQESDYFYQPVCWAGELGVTNGTSSTTFSPDAVCTRAEAVTLYWRAAGEPPYCDADNPYPNPYSDISEDDYFYDAAMYCSLVGLFPDWDWNGTEFEPDRPVTRIQVINMFRIAGMGGQEEEVECPFTDLPADAFDAGTIRWCYKWGIISGTSSDRFEPDRLCTRAMMVTFLWRIYFDSDSVTIIYTNDVHTYIDNHTTGSDGSRQDLISYGNVAAVKESFGESSNVLLVDAGDHSQGTAYGAMDQGRSVIQLMNAAGYDLATLGNHEFDYGQERLFGLMDEADFPYVSCNFYQTADDSLVLPAYEILDAGNVKVAFIGITTPETYTSAPKAYFADDAGNQIYGIYGVEDPQQLYDSVQAAIDEIGDQADYIIALGHLGTIDIGRGWTSTDVIEHTTGLDAFIDGHSHTTMVEELVTDAAGNEVTLTQTGCYLNTIGVMQIIDGEITTSLLTAEDAAGMGRDETVQDLTDSWVSSVDATLGDQIAVSDIDFTTKDPETGRRIVRNQETNLGDLIADSVYWYFNDVQELSCDVAIINGGGIRADLPAGEVSYLDSKTVQTFGNVECMVKLKGSALRDMLEYSAQYIGRTNEDGTPVEFGGFLQVAGMQFTIDTSIPSTVQTYADGSWAGSPTGEYRVKDIEIYNRETGSYEPLDPDRDYTVAGINYILRDGGNGYQMFGDAEPVLDYVGEDYLIAAEYFEAFAEGSDAWPHISTANSPLASYSGYHMDYENPFGAGRITIQ